MPSTVIGIKGHTHYPFCHGRQIDGRRAEARPLLITSLPGVECFAEAQIKGVEGDLAGGAFHPTV